ncbi:MAG: EF-hand domain-containing protein [Bacteroidota bacterium]
MKAFEKIFPIATAVIIVLLVVYFSPTDLTGRYNHKKAMSALDSNGDQQLDNSEIENLDIFLNKLDMTSEGISLNSLDIEHRDLIKVIDTDHNGLLSESEMKNAKAHLISLDKDGDQLISLKELK